MPRDCTLNSRLLKEVLVDFILVGVKSAEVVVCCYVLWIVLVLINHMRSFFSRYFRCYILLCLTLLAGCGQHSHEKKLTDLENQYLETFFRHLFETTTGGYVLYGDKPLLLCPFRSIEKTIPGTLEHKDAVIFTQGLKALKKLNIQSKNYLLVSLNAVNLSINTPEA